MSITFVVLDTELRGIRHRVFQYIVLYQKDIDLYPQVNSTLNTYLTPLGLWITPRNGKV